MSALDLINTHAADKLIGRYVLTERIGDWPGGLALVVGVTPDPDAPEIVLYVQQKGETMGIFENEQIILIPDNFCLPDGIA